MMRVVLSLLLATAPAASGLAAPPTTSGADRLGCQTLRVQHAAPSKPLHPRRLDELPAGNLYRAVERQVDGCRELVLVSEERRRR